MKNSVEWFVLEPLLPLIGFAGFVAFVAACFLYYCWKEDPK